MSQLIIHFLPNSCDTAGETPSYNFDRKPMTPINHELFHRKKPQPFF